jgi:hypothetical protein
MKSQAYLQWYIKLTEPTMQLQAVIRFTLFEHSELIE